MTGCNDEAWKTLLYIRRWCSFYSKCWFQTTGSFLVRFMAPRELRLSKCKEASILRKKKKWEKVIKSKNTAVRSSWTSKDRTITQQREAEWDSSSLIGGGGGTTNNQAIKYPFANKTKQTSIFMNIGQRFNYICNHTEIGNIFKKKCSEHFPGKNERCKSRTESSQAQRESSICLLSAECIELCGLGRY